MRGERMSQATAAEPTTSQGPLELSRVQMNVVFVTILLGLLLSALDQTIVSTALPTIVGDLGGAGHVSWVVTAYMLAETVSTGLAVGASCLSGRCWYERCHLALEGLGRAGAPAL